MKKWLKCPCFYACSTLLSSSRSPLSKEFPMISWQSILGAGVQHTDGTQKWTVEQASLFLGHPEEQQRRKSSCGQNLKQCIWCSLYSEGKMARGAIINQLMAAVNGLLSNLRTHSTSCPGTQTAEGKGEDKVQFASHCWTVSQQSRLVETNGQRWGEARLLFTKPLTLRECL